MRPVPSWLWVPVAGMCAAAFAVELILWLVFRWEESDAEFLGGDGIADWF